ncbi:hypothetical protein [Streptomyces lydicus]|uniref:hypothetical protein n=1 Tax=Streptomyces lydicus TaxID=47763 RepID=UPI0036EAC367
MSKYLRLRRRAWNASLLALVSSDFAWSGCAASCDAIFPGDARNQAAPAENGKGDSVGCRKVK